MNPYTSRTMIKDPAAFVGRAAELRDVYTLLAAMQSCSIVGPRRLGKSSLLYHLTHPSTYAPHLPDPERYVFAFVDLQELTGLGPEDFFFTAVERLGRSGKGRLEANPERDGTHLGFRRFLGRVTDDGLRLVLCCDEFEMLSQNARFNADFFAYLRGLCSNYSLALVTSSQASLFDLCHQGNLQTSQFWNIFVERALGLMAEDEARSLIREPFARAGSAVAPDEVSFVLDLAGRHPFFIQIVCYHLFESRASSGSPDHAAIEGRFFDEARRHYAYEWDQLDEPDRQSLAAVARAEGYTLDPARFQRLKRRVLVVGSPGSPSIASAGWRRFIEEQLREAATAQPPASTATGSPPASPGVGGSLTGSRLGPYEVLEPLGRGGMADVYKGRHVRLERTVAIKVLPADLATDPNFRLRFEREARAVAALKHPNIVQVFDFGDVDGLYYMVMEYIAGRDLAHVMREVGPMSLQRVRPLAQDIAGALDYAHTQGLVHRDVKPSNVMLEPVTASGGRDQRAILTDFGIAKILTGSTGPTKTGVIGTLDYMAPEQINASGQVDGRADVYALGVMLYQMFTGRLPFTGDTPGAVLMAHLQQPAPDPRALVPGLPENAAAAILGALAKDPAERFPTAGELVGALG